MFYNKFLKSSAGMEALATGSAGSNWAAESFKESKWNYY
jgi:hypothetical protein